MRAEDVEAKHNRPPLGAESLGVCVQEATPGENGSPAKSATVRCCMGLHARSWPVRPHAPSSSASAPERAWRAASGSRSRDRASPRRARGRGSARRRDSKWRARDAALDSLLRAFDDARSCWKARDAEGKGGAPRHDRDVKWDALGKAPRGEIPVLIRASALSFAWARVERDWTACARASFGAQTVARVA